MHDTIYSFAPRAARYDGGCIGGTPMPDLRRLPIRREEYMKRAFCPSSTSLSPLYTSSKTIAIQVVVDDVDVGILLCRS
jgi:hypothetical protein